MAWIAAAAGIVGSLIASDGASSAADTQAGATEAGVAEQRRQFDLARSDSAPYRAAGGRALGQLETGLNTPTTAADVMADPGYQFGLDQGQQAIDRKSAASGGRISGASLKSAARFATGTAASGYNAAYQRGQDRLNRLAALANVGQTSTASSAASGANSANAISNMITAQGNAAGAARLAQGNIWGNAVNQIGAAYGRSNSPTINTQYNLPSYAVDPYGN